MTPAADAKPAWSLWRRLAPSFYAVCVGVVFLALLKNSRVALPRLTSVFFLQLAIATTFSTAMHEAGHALAAVCAGFRLRMFGVWPVRLVRSGNAWRVRWIGGRRAGFISVDPVIPNRLPTRLAIVVAAGPAASFATGLAAAYFPATRHLSDWFAAQLNLIAFVSLSSAILNLLPGISRFAVTDGQRLRMLSKGGAASERYCLLLLLGSASFSGVRPRDWNADLVKLLPGPLDGSPDSWMAQLLRYNWLIDRGQVAEAGAVLQSILNDNLPPQLKETLQLQASWFQARFRANLPEARRWMDLSPIRKRREAGYRCTLLRAQAAIAFLEQRWTDAATAAAEALRQRTRLDDAGAAKVISEGIIRLQRDIASANRADPTLVQRR